MELILASASPRRKELLTFTGIPFTVLSSDAAECSVDDPAETVILNACSKCGAIVRNHPGSIVLGADTVVYLPGRKEILGKPRNEDDARRMLHLLNGNEHRVYTGVCVSGPLGENKAYDAAEVVFDRIPDDVIDGYIASGEYKGKAGAYAIQGSASRFVRRVNGSVTCVIGLPMHLVREMLLPYGLLL